MVDSLRALLTGAPTGHTVYLALAWCAAIALAGYLWRGRVRPRDPVRS